MVQLYSVYKKQGSVWGFFCKLCVCVCVRMRVKESPDWMFDILSYPVCVVLRSHMMRVISLLCLLFLTVLQLRLQQRRTREQLVDQGIMPREYSQYPSPTLLN